MQRLPFGAVSVALALSCPVAIACSCDEDTSIGSEQIKNALSDADFVAVVEVVSTSVVVVAKEETWSSWSWTDKQYHPTTEIVEDRQLVAEVNVLRLWKGNGSINEVATPAEWQACGIEFLAGQQLLVYGYGPDEHGRIQTGSCTRTNLVEDAHTDIETLGNLTLTEPPNNALERSVTDRQPCAAGARIIVAPAALGQAVPRPAQRGR